MPPVYEGEAWKIERFVSGFSNNAYLITSIPTGMSVIIDTPARPRDLIAAASQTTVRGILITHNHWDHLQGFDEALQSFRAPVGIGARDAAAIEGKALAGLLDVSDGAHVEVCDFSIRALETPGHTPGSTCYVLGGEIGQGETPHVFTGDTLFPGGPGKSRSPEALEQLIDSITGKLYSLPDEAVVLPGHGEFTSIGRSKSEYLAFAERGRPPGLYGDVTWSGA